MAATKLAAHLLQPNGPRFSVPEGLNDSVSQVSICQWNRTEPMRSNRLYETDSFFLRIPGSKLPGNVHPVQSIRAPRLTSMGQLPDLYRMGLYRFFLAPSRLHANW